MVSILTWFKANNHGAVLQAYASQQILSRLGVDNTLLNYERKVVSPKFCTRIENYVYRLQSGSLRYRKIWKKFDEGKSLKFEKFRKSKLKITSDLQHACDCLMIGSDMVFDLKQGYNPFMFAINVNANKVFSFAASSGGSDVKLAYQMKIVDDIRKGLSRFDAIGCRDQETMDFVRHFVNNSNIVKNIDPVLLYGFDRELEEWDSGKWKNEKFILLYAYHGNLDKKDEYKGIIDYAHQNGCKVVSCGYYHPWCDENVNASPTEFVEMFKYALAIATDTFHGTIFSLIFRKNFVSMVRGNAFKLKFLLDEVHMNNRIASDEITCDMILRQYPDYSFFDSWIGDVRSANMDYLREQTKM